MADNELQPCIFCDTHTRDGKDIHGNFACKKCRQDPCHYCEYCDHINTLKCKLSFCIVETTVSLAPIKPPAGLTFPTPKTAKEDDDMNGTKEINDIQRGIGELEEILQRAKAVEDVLDELTSTVYGACDHHPTAEWVALQKADTLLNRKPQEAPND